MPRRGIDQLRPPHKRYRPDKARHGGRQFETKRQARNERETRIRKLKAAAKLVCGTNPTLAKAFLNLATGLRWDDRRGLPSQACAIYVRRQRLRVVGALWRFIRCNQLRRSTHFVTIIPRDWQFTMDELPEVDPRKLLRAFRARLDRLGATGSDGFFIAFIDGSYDERLGVFQLHLHGVAQGGMLDVLRRLRRSPDFRSASCGGQPQGGDRGRCGGRVVNPVQIKRQHLRQLPRPLSYLVKGYWAGGSSSEGENGGERGDRRAGRRTRHMQRISEPAHSVSLLWRDRWELKDITLLIGVWVGRGGFSLS